MLKNVKKRVVEDKIEDSNQISFAYLKVMGKVGLISTVVFKGNESMVFLVGAFSLKEKSPTLTVSSFFLFLFFSVDNLTLSGPLFLQFVHLSYLFIFHLRPSRRAWVRFSH